MRQQGEPQVLIIGLEHMAWASIRDELWQSHVAVMAGDPEALALAARLQPDIVLMEAPRRASMVPRLVEGLRASCPAAKVVIVGDLPDDLLALALGQQLVDGHLTWPILRRGTVRRVVENLWHDDVRITSKDAGGHRRPACGKETPAMALSEKEYRILKAVAAGKQQTEVEGFSASTVKRCLVELQERLGVDHTNSLLFKAGELHLLDEGSRLEEE